MGMNKPKQVISLGKPIWVNSRFSRYDAQWRTFTAVLLALDALSVWIGLSIAYEVWIKRESYSEPSGFGQTAYPLLMLVSIGIFWLVYRMFGLYDRDNLMGGVTEYGRVLPATMFAAVMVIVTGFVLREQFMTISRGWLFVSIALISAFVGFHRFMLRQGGRWLRRRSSWLTARVLIVGANDQGVAVARQWNSTTNSGMKVVGFLDDFKPIGTRVLDSIEVIGRPTQLTQIARETGAHEVMVVWNAVAWETFEEIIRTAGLPKEYTLRLSPGFYDLLTTSVTVTNNTVVPLLTINAARIVGVDALLKLAFDYLLVLPALVLMSPLMTAIALALKLSGKSVLARHPTIGQGGKVFDMFKFKTGFTVVSGSISLNHADATTWQAAEPPTLTERFLYYSGLDKLPQIFNVLTRQMSLVGPRPRVMGDDNSDVYVAAHLQAVKPGMIGPWSIQQYLDPDDEVRDDMHYVRNWEISLDMRILLVTVFAIKQISRLARPRWVELTRKHASRADKKGLGEAHKS